MVEVLLGLLAFIMFLAAFAVKDDVLGAVFLFGVVAVLAALGGYRDLVWASVALAFATVLYTYVKRRG